MILMKRISGAAALGVAMLTGAGRSAPPAQAGFLLTLMQQGSNVVATGYGSIDTAGLNSLGFLQKAEIFPSNGDIFLGPTTPQLATEYDTGLVGFQGPLSFGRGGETFASSGIGDILGLAAAGVLSVPVGYVSGSVLFSRAIFNNQTFSSLGVTPGTYLWTLGSGPSADAFTLTVGVGLGTPVPEPSSVLLLALPLGFVLLRAARPRLTQI